MVKMANSEPRMPKRERANANLNLEPRTWNLEPNLNTNREARTEKRER